MTPLRKRMPARPGPARPGPARPGIEDLQLKGYGEWTRETYVRTLRQLAQHYNKFPDLITEEKIGDYYFQYGKNVTKCLPKRDGQGSRSTGTIAICRIKFFFKNTLTLVRAKREKKLPTMAHPQLTSSRVHPTIPSVPRRHSYGASATRPPTKLHQGPALRGMGSSTQQNVISWPWLHTSYTPFSPSLLTPLRPELTPFAQNAAILYASLVDSNAAPDPLRFTMKLRKTTLLYPSQRNHCASHQGTPAPNAPSALSIRTQKGLHHLPFITSTNINLVPPPRNCIPPHPSDTSNLP
jgi:hypothetical protein